MPEREAAARTAGTVATRHNGSTATPATVGAPAAHPVLGLQRAIGNSAVQSMVGRLESRLPIGPRDGPLEREAHAVEDHVRRHGAGETKCGSGCQHGPAQECPACRALRLTLHRAPVSDAPAPPSAPAIVQRVLRDAGTPLDARTRLAFEPMLGRQLDDVRVHADLRAAHSADAVNAAAYTVGSHMVFSAGRYAPHTRDGDALLAHELTHVAQQSTGDPTLRRQPADTGVSDAGPGIADSGLLNLGPPSDADTLTVEPDDHWTIFRGVTLQDDAAMTRATLRAFAADQGMEKLHELVSAFREDIRERRYDLSDHSGVTDETVAAEAGLVRDYRILGVMQTETASLQSEADELLDEAEQRATYTLRQLLDTSEERVTGERERYGVSETRETHWQRSSDFGESSSMLEVRVTYQMATNDATRGLRAAAGALEQRARHFLAVVEERNGLISYVASEFEATEVIKDQPRYDELQKQIRDAKRDYNLLRAEKEARYPILASFDAMDSEGTYYIDNTIEALSGIASGSHSTVAQTLFEDIDKKLRAIAKVWKALQEGDLKVWRVESVMALTKQSMELGTGTFGSRVIDDKVEQVESDRGLVEMALGLVALALGLLAAIPTGGSSLVAAGAFVAGLGAAGISSYLAVTHLQEYMLEQAEGGTDFDRARAVSQSDPSLFWLAVDIVGAVLDVHAAASAFRTLARTARVAMAARRAVAVAGAAGGAEHAAVTALRTEADVLLGTGEGERVVQSMERASDALPAAVREAEAEVETGVRASRTLADGHELKAVGPHKRLVVCSWPCEYLESRFARELRADPALRTRWAEIDARLNAAVDDTAFQAAFRDAEVLEADLRLPHRQYLGSDLENPAKPFFREHEADAAEHIEQSIGRPLERLDAVNNPAHAYKTGDWYDPVGRVSYDAVGPVPAGRFNLWQFTSQIWSPVGGHLRKTALDVVFVDLSGLTHAQRTDVLRFVNGLPRMSKPRLVLFP